MDARVERLRWMLRETSSRDLAEVIAGAESSVEEWRWTRREVRPPGTVPYASEREAGASFGWLKRAPAHPNDGAHHGISAAGAVLMTLVNLRRGVFPAAFSTRRSPRLALVAPDAQNCRR